jgi:hypothetical protein
MPQSAEDSVRIAILSEPSAFGLTASDTNPMLLYQLRKNEPAYREQGTAELWKLCFDNVNAVLYDKVTEVFAATRRALPVAAADRPSARARRDKNHELVRDATATDSQEQEAVASAAASRWMSEHETQSKGMATTSPYGRAAPAKSNGKPKSCNNGTETSNSNGRGDKLTVKQLRYMGFLYRKLGVEPDYSVISILTQGQATMRIKELEQRVQDAA